MKKIFFCLLIGILCTPFPTLAANTEEEAYTIAVGLYNDGLIDLARDQFKNFLRQFPNSVQAAYVQYLIGECDYRQKKYESAIQEYRKGMTECPGNLYIDKMAYKLGRSYFWHKIINQRRRHLKLLFIPIHKVLTSNMLIIGLGKRNFQRGKYQQGN
jgi:outer membrane protein assembly factor BamD (BamD/ComL family)